MAFAQMLLASTLLLHCLDHHGGAAPSQRVLFLNVHDGGKIPARGWESLFVFGFRFGDWPCVLLGGRLVSGMGDGMWAPGEKKMHET